MNPVRQSAWEDPEVAALVEDWGETRDSTERSPKRWRRWLPCASRRIRS